MIRFALPLILIVILVGCSGKPATIGQLRRVDINIDAEKNAVGLDEAIASYKRFLDETNDTPMTPEAIRRMADLKVEKEYGQIADTSTVEVNKVEASSSETALHVKQDVAFPQPTEIETDTDFENRNIVASEIEIPAIKDELPPGDGLTRAGAQEAVAHYRKLLEEFPEYERNDQALYQLSRALEEQGQVEEAMLVMNQLAAKFPDSRYLGEVQFRRAEYFFARRKYLDAEEAYGNVVDLGEKSDFYVLALYKLGWSFYKQDLYTEALHRHIKLIDFKVANGIDLENIVDDQDKKRIKDTLRIISQSFSNLGGVSAVIDYFSQHGSRAYEYMFYAHLAKYYVSKQRYNDAVTTMTTFIDRNPTHRQAPLFMLRVIAINKIGGFASLVVEAKKTYARSYGFGAKYWKHFNPDYRPEVVEGLKVTLIDLANHYHALYQDKELVEKKSVHLKDALYWYREFLASFPVVAESAAINYQLAELLLENNLFAEAAQEYEKTAYVYPVFDKADKAGYAAVYAYREHLKRVALKDKDQVKRDIIRVSLKFAEYYPKHKKAALVLAAAVDELYVLRDFKTALIAARHLISRFPEIPADIRRSALLVAAHSSYELEAYSEAEAAYTEVLPLYSKDDKLRQVLLDNLVASIYKQGEAANRSRNYKKAAEYFLKVASVAPTSAILPTAEFDGAVALIKVEEWQGATKVLTGFRKKFPKHKLQYEVTKKLAYVYQENERFDLAAVEFERIEIESTDPALRQEALLTAAELYEQINDLNKASKVYRRYVEEFPVPIDINIEARGKLANIHLLQGKKNAYLDELKRIVILEADAGSAQTAQTREIAGAAALVLAKKYYEEFISVRLVEPFVQNLQRKQTLMKKLTEIYSKIFEYEIGVVTAEATFYLAEIYADFSEALLKSERPKGLSSLEFEEYELALEEQAYPFEEKAIEMHQNNLELISKNVYNDWIDKSLEKLSVFMPARYGKLEVANNEIASMTEFRFENIALMQTAQTNVAPTVKDKGNRLKSGKETKKRADDAPQVSVSRLENGRTGFIVTENFHYDVNRRDLFVLGVDALESGEYGVAVDCFESITATSPSQSAPYINLAIAYIRSDRDAQAEESLKKALELVAGHPLASHEYGLLLRRAGRFDEAREVYADSLKLFPEYFPHRKNLGVLCDLYLGDLKCAANQFEMFLEAQPGNEEVKLWLSEVQARQGY